MKKSSLKTFLAGKNPLDYNISKLKGAQQLGGGGTLEKQKDSDGQFNQWVDGFECVWFCDVLDDGTAVTYYPGD